MYNSVISIDNKNDLIEDLIISTSNSKAYRHILVPDNRAEIIIPYVEKLSVRPVGHSRDVHFDINSGYFFTPRRRGLEIISKSDTIEYLIIKINPIYSKFISEALELVANGIYKLNWNDTFVRNLSLAHSLRNFRDLNRIVGEIFEKVFEDFDIDSVSETLLESIEKIKYASGSIKVKEIYSTLSVSKSKLEQHFNREIGLTPKEFCKIEKINYFIRSYYKNEGKSLTELTYKCGYYDQSHLIKDFRYFMDISPKQYFEQLA